MALAAPSASAPKRLAADLEGISSGGSMDGSGSSASGSGAEDSDGDAGLDDELAASHERPAKSASSALHEL